MNFLISKAIWFAKMVRRRGMVSFFTDPASYAVSLREFFLIAFGFVFVKPMSEQIRLMREEDIDAQVVYSQTAFFGLIRPIQNHFEISAFLRLIKERKPKFIIEIGTARGGTLFLFTRAASDDATIISVDLPYGDQGTGYPDWKAKLYLSFARASQKIHLVKGDSHSLDTKQKISEILCENKADLLFIDGDHSYEGVKVDYSLYGPLVRDDGIIAFHDIKIRDSDCEDVSVSAFWNEIKDSKKSMEIVDPNFKPSHPGIGVLFMGGR